MTILTFFFILIPALAVILLSVTLILAPHEPYKEKETPFECGYHSFIQTRVEVNVIHFGIGLLFLIFDLEIVLTFPYVVSSMFNGIYGLTTIVLFISVLTLGFIFEIGKKALKFITKISFNKTDNNLLLSSLFTNRSYLKAYLVTLLCFGLCFHIFNVALNLKASFLIGVLSIIVTRTILSFLGSKQVDWNIVYIAIILFTLMYIAKVAILDVSSCLYQYLFVDNWQEDINYIIPFFALISHFLSDLLADRYLLLGPNDISSLDSKPNSHISYMEKGGDDPGESSSKRKRGRDSPLEEESNPNKRRRNSSDEEAIVESQSTNKRKRDSSSDLEDTRAKRVKVDNDEQSLSGSHITNEPTVEQEAIHETAVKEEDVQQPIAEQETLQESIVESNQPLPSTEQEQSNVEVEQLEQSDVQPEQQEQSVVQPEQQEQSNSELLEQEQEQSSVEEVEQSSVEEVEQEESNVEPEQVRENPANLGNGQEADLWYSQDTSYYSESSEDFDIDQETRQDVIDQAEQLPGRMRVVQGLITAGLRLAEGDSYRAPDPEAITDPDTNHIRVAEWEASYAEVGANFSHVENVVINSEQFCEISRQKLDTLRERHSSMEESRVKNEVGSRIDSLTNHLNTLESDINSLRHRYNYVISSVNENGPEYVNGQVNGHVNGHVNGNVNSTDNSDDNGNGND